MLRRLVVSFFADKNGDRLFSCPCMSIAKTAEMLGLDGNRAFCCAFWGHAFTLGIPLFNPFSSLEQFFSISAAGTNPVEVQHPFKILRLRGFLVLVLLLVLYSRSEFASAQIRASPKSTIKREKFATVDFLLNKRELHAHLRSWARNRWQGRSRSSNWSKLFLNSFWLSVRSFEISILTEAELRRIG